MGIEQLQGTRKLQACVSSYSKNCVSWYALLFFSALHVLPKSPKILTLKPIIYDFVSLRGVGSRRAGSVCSMCRKNGFSKLPIFFLSLRNFLFLKTIGEERKKRSTIHTDPLFLDQKIKRTKLVMTFQTAFTSSLMLYSDTVFFLIKSLLEMLFSKDGKGKDWSTKTDNFDKLRRVKMER